MTRFRHFALAVALVIPLALALSGCAGLPGVGGDDGPLGDVSKMTVVDLRAALARATAADDKPAMMCYPVLIEVVESIDSRAPDTNFAGPIDAFEAARLLTKKATAFSGSNNAMIQKVNLGCAALYNDAKGDILRLLVKFRP
jgi:hypothetical protein